MGNWHRPPGWPIQCHTKGRSSVWFLFPPFFFPSFFFLSFCGKSEASAANAAGNQWHSTFYHFLLFTVICIRVVRKIPVPEGQWFNGKSILIIHFQPEFHTLRGTWHYPWKPGEKQLPHRPHPQGFQSFYTRGVAVQRFVKILWNPRQKQRLGD